MKLVFPGTRGEIEARTRRHRMHSSLLVSYRNARVMIDCGLDWLGKFERLRPSAIVLTHADPDHAWGLKNGAPCPVYAPQKTWRTLQSCSIKDRHLIQERTPTNICGIMFAMSRLLYKQQIDRCAGVLRPLCSFVGEADSFPYSQ
jgi:phosphoribosyl 1,2-cyclic phosphodiesterase